MIVSAQRLAEELERYLQAATPTSSDSYGGGATRLVSVGCPAGNASCLTQFVLVFSQLRGVPTRIQLILFFEQLRHGELQLMWTTMGPLGQPGEESAALKGGTFTNFQVPPGWSSNVTFHPLNP